MRMCFTIPFSFFSIYISVLSSHTSCCLSVFFLRLCILFPVVFSFLYLSTLFSLHVHICTHMCTKACTYTHTFTPTHPHTHIHTHTHTHTPPHTLTDASRYLVFYPTVHGPRYDKFKIGLSFPEHLKYQNESQLDLNQGTPDERGHSKRGF